MIKHIHDGKHDIDGLANQIGLKLRTGHRPQIEQPQVERWLRDTPAWIIRLAIEQTIASGQAIRFVVGPRLKEKVFLCDPARFGEPGALYLLECSEQLAEQLAGKYRLTSRVAQVEQRQQASQAAKEAAAQAQAQAQADHELFVVKQNVQVAVEIATGWEKSQRRELAQSYEHIADGHSSSEARNLEIAKIPGLLAHRKRSFVEGEFYKRLGRHIDLALLDKVAPLPQVEPA